ncbi:MAG: MBL fold metallo-hydrolase [Chloroflexi bacterium]|nr:MBL fold metallo-hydrolase [Chloroflexota bacterium]
MKICINGAAQTVTGSQYLLEVNGKRLLLECGMFQGRREESYQKNLNFPFDPRRLDAAILSHAHIDHSGNLPNLVKHGYRGPIYTTPPTARLADIMLRDSGHIQEADVQFVNRRRLRNNLPPIEPLYTLEDAAQVAPLFKTMLYDQSFEPIPGVTVRLVEAGHILGSAAIVLDITENGRKFRLWFSGDIGREKLPLLCNPVLPQDTDYLMMECTYGDKPHRDPELAFNEFRQVVLRTFQRGGKVIVPSFAVGRTQELVYFLNQMESSGDLPYIPVYVDSPLAVEASKIFDEFPQYFDDETRKFVRASMHPALSFKGLKYVQSVDESKALNDRYQPMVIISASGMAETGRILHHLRNNIENSRNCIVIVSWQAPYTLGRRLVDGEKKVKIFGEEFDVHAEVVSIGGLSAHAGQDMLLRYAQASRASLKQLILVHGEENAEAAFQQKLVEARIGPVVYPKMFDTIEI